MKDVVNTLHHTAQVLDRHENGVSFSQVGNFMGIVIEIYRWDYIHNVPGYFDNYGRARVQHHLLEDEKEGLQLRTKILLDILSLKAFNEAFEDCQDEDDHADLRTSFQPFKFLPLYNRHPLRQSPSGNLSDYLSTLSTLRRTS